VEVFDPASTRGTDCSESESESYVTTDGQPASLSWNKAPIWGLRPDLDYCLTVEGLLIWGALALYSLWADPMENTVSQQFVGVLTAPLPSNEHPTVPRYASAERV
jgi:hypothetical protein